jgi:hypothetical protein
VHDDLDEVTMLVDVQIDYRTTSTSKRRYVDCHQRAKLRGRGRGSSKSVGQGRSRRGQDEVEAGGRR